MIIEYFTGRRTTRVPCGRAPRRAALILTLLSGAGLAIGAGSAAGVTFHQTISAPVSVRESGPAPGSTLVRHVGPAQIRVYTPRSYRADRRHPLVVMVHGCNTNATEQQAASAFERVADRRGFVVMFAEHDQRETVAVGTHPVRCWRFWSPADIHRGQGDPALVVAETRLVQREWSIDRSRTYVVGMSSGGMLTSTLGATYPDVFAAIGVVAGCGYGAGAACFLPPYHALDPSSREAAAAHAEQGRRARALPMIGIHGTADTTIPPAAGPGTVRQWVKAANLAVSGHDTRPVRTTSPERVVRTPGRRTYTVADFRFPRSGCLLARRVTIRGMGHFWPGGSTSPNVSQWTDPMAPNGAAMVWSFFRSFRLGSPPSHCVHPQTDPSRRP